MAGLAAMIGAAGARTTPAAAVAAIAAALAARGPDSAGWQWNGTGQAGGDIQLAVRAGMPAVHEVDGYAVVLDGNAAPSALAAGYAAHGPAGLMAGADPYAAILADPRRGRLLLARHGDGAPLYWAAHAGAVFVASEPAALLAAGVPAVPDQDTVDRFLATGACDDTTATFFAGIRRVPPATAVEIQREPDRSGFAVRSHAGPVPPRPSLLAGRVGLRLGPGVTGLAALEYALGLPGVPRPLPVYSATFPELAAAGTGTGAAPGLGRLARSAEVRHRALPFFTDQVDVDAYLSDVGEPTPHLDDWLLWAVARRVAGEVDALIDTAAAAGGGYRSRLADRLATRFGVELRHPGLRHPGTPPAGQPAALVADLIRQMRAELVTAFLEPGGETGLAQLTRLLTGRHADPEALWRRYLLERWLRCVVAPVRSSTVVTSPAPVSVAAATWTRHPVRTELLAAGEKLPEKLAWYVGEHVSDGADLAGPWYVLVAAKPVAVMQGRARNLWDIRPGLAARALHRADSRPVAPFVTQVAIEECGRWRAVTAAAAALVGRTSWYARLAGQRGTAIRPPRPDAVPPAQVAVVPAPAEPDLVAGEVVAALRTALPEPAYATLGGCAVVAATGEVLGWSGHRPPAGLLLALTSGDPFGDDQTPVVLATPAPGRGR